MTFSTSTRCRLPHASGCALALALALMAALLAPGTAAAAGTPGTLDLDFGTDGLVSTDFEGLQNRIGGLTIQPDGKIVAAGFTGPSPIDFAIARYLENGNLDPTFGTDGKVISRHGLPGLSSQAHDVAVDADGGILVAGWANNGQGPTQTDFDFTLARYLDDGSLDPTFGVGGVAFVDFDARRDIATALAIDPEGRIVLVGHSESTPGSSSTRDLALARLLPDGSLDPEFGTGGTILDPTAEERSEGRAVVLDPDGGILVAGMAVQDGTRDMLLRRYHEDGTPDTDFGIVLLDLGGSDRANAVEVQPDGKILLAGRTDPGTPDSEDSLVARYLSDGTLDPDFGTDGVVVTDVLGGDDDIEDLIHLPDGTILTGGWASPGGDSNSRDFAVLRYLPDGNLDPSFGTGGIATTNFFGFEDRINAVAFDSAGRLVAGGRTQTGPSSDTQNFALARFFAGRGPITMVVNSTADKVAANPGDGICDTGDTVGPANDPECTLRAAVMEANTGPGGDEIILPDPATVLVPGESYLLTIEGRDEDEAATGDLDLVRDVTITGAGAEVAVVDGGGVDRIFDVHDGVSASISGVGITGGEAGSGRGAAADGGGGIRVGENSTLTLDGAAVTGNAVEDGGGGIAVYGGTVDVTDSRIEENSAPDCCGGGIYSDSGTVSLMRSSVDRNTAELCCGGGVFQRNAATLTVTESSIDQNSAPDCCGGGIFSDGSEATLTDSSVDDNLADNCCGGGIFSSGSMSGPSVLTLTRSSVDRNIVEECCGGGIFSRTGSFAPAPAELTIIDSSVSNNELRGDSAFDGGGILHTGNLTMSGSTVSGNRIDRCCGGGMELQGGGTAEIVNSTFSGNVALEGDGAGILGRDMTLVNVTITGNVAPDDRPAGGIWVGSNVTAVNTIIAGNSGGDCAGSDLISAGHNLDSDASCFGSGDGSALDEENGAGTDLVGVDPRLEPLLDNGGPTLTHGLRAGSPAIGAGDPDACPATDQRGVARPQGPTCDIGAYEFQFGAQRLAGATRIQTAIETSRNTYPDGAAQMVALARADLFPDALAGAPLAITLEGPLLLTGSVSLHADTQTEIQRVLPPGGTVHLLGGATAISEGIQTQLESLGYTVVRYPGANRYHTAALIADAIPDPQGIFIATGLLFPDALAAGAAAGHQGAVVLLTAGPIMPSVTQAWIDSNPTLPRWAAGGPAATADPDSTPLVGADRYETATLVAAAVFTEPALVGIATGLDWPDAATGATHVGQLGGPILVTHPDTLSPATATYLTDETGFVQRAFFYGGLAALTQEVEDQTTELLTP